MWDRILDNERYGRSRLCSGAVDPLGRSSSTKAGWRSPIRLARPLKNCVAKSGYRQKTVRIEKNRRAVACAPGQGIAVNWIACVNDAKVAR